VFLGPFIGECQTLMNAKTVLLVDNDETELIKPDILLKKGVCADYDARFTRYQLVEDGFASFALGATT